MNPLHDPRFRRIFAAQVIALTGTGLSTIALTLLAYRMANGNAATVLGIALACKMVAYVVFAPIVGGLAHRFSRKPFLIVMDLLRAAVILTIPFAKELWQLYLLVFVLNLFSAGFKPVFSAMIPDILPDERSYTQALSYSRLAYDLENLLSPLLASLALGFMSYTGLFTFNSLAFLASAGILAATRLPRRNEILRSGGTFTQITFGIRAYLATPRLRGVLALYFGVAIASSMVIVNTIVIIRDSLGLDESYVAWAFAASGFGSMLVALSLPKALEILPDRSFMIAGAWIMALALGLLSTEPSWEALLVLWFLIGAGWSLVQTPAGRVLNRSSAPSDRAAYFSAQFALSHACWLLLYPIIGYAFTGFGLQLTAIASALGLALVTLLATLIWKKEDPSILTHQHESVEHSHMHVHDEHHQHDHKHGTSSTTIPHTHSHAHPTLDHSHPFVIDDHHLRWPCS